jgi:hypothetical protein
MSKVEMNAKAHANRTIGSLVASWEGSSVEEDIRDEYEMFLDSIEFSKNKTGYWKVEVENFGWRRCSGHKYFEANTMRDLINKCLPNTENIFNIFHYNDGYAIQNYHHDSCTGDEFYYIVPSHLFPSTKK